MKASLIVSVMFGQLLPLNSNGNPNGMLQLPEKLTGNEDSKDILQSEFE